MVLPHSDVHVVGNVVDSIQRVISVLYYVLCNKPPFSEHVVLQECCLHLETLLPPEKHKLSISARQGLKPVLDYRTALEVMHDINYGHYHCLLLCCTHLSALLKTVAS